MTPTRISVQGTHRARVGSGERAGLGQRPGGRREERRAGGDSAAKRFEHGRDRGLRMPPRAGLRPRMRRCGGAKAIGRTSTPGASRVSPRSGAKATPITRGDGVLHGRVVVELGHDPGLEAGHAARARRELMARRARGGLDPRLLGKLLDPHCPLARSRMARRKHDAHGLLEQRLELEPVVARKRNVVVLEHDGEIKLPRPQLGQAGKRIGLDDAHLRSGPRALVPLEASGRMVTAAVVIEPRRSGSSMPANRLTSASASARPSRMPSVCSTRTFPASVSVTLDGPRRSS